MEKFTDFARNAENIRRFMTSKNKTLCRDKDNNKTLNKNKSKVNNTKEQNDIDREPKQDVLLIRIATKYCQFFHNNQNEAFVKINLTDHTEIWNLNSAGFKDWISRQLWVRHKQGLNSISYKSAIAVLRGMAVYEGATQEVYLRVAQTKDTIYIDICNDKWQVIKINNKGWEVIDQSPVAFIRSKNMQPLPLPNQQGDINLLRKHLNIQDKDFVLIVGWLLMSLQAGRGAYPIMVLQGSAGCGKTTISRMLRQLVDPNKADLLSKPKTQDMRVIGVNNHVLAFDNLSGIHPNYSDALCKIATGDNQTVRVLYTTNDEMTLSIKKPILLNGIDEIAERGDLVSRSIKIELQKLKQSKTETSVWSEFMANTPDILGALLDGLSMSLKNSDKIKIDQLLRMSDFCKWASAGGNAYGWNKNDFMTAYRENIQSSYIDSIEASTFATGIVQMFKDRLEFEGSPLELLQEVEDSFISDKVKHSHNWITTAKGVMNKLNRYQDALEVYGITFVKEKDRTNRTILTITRNVDKYNQAIKATNQSNEQWLNDYDKAKVS